MKPLLAIPLLAALPLLGGCASEPLPVAFDTSIRFISSDERQEANGLRLIGRPPALKPGRNEWNVQLVNCFDKRVVLLWQRPPKICALVKAWDGNGKRVAVDGNDCGFPGSVIATDKWIVLSSSKRTDAWEMVQVPMKIAFDIPAEAEKVEIILGLDVLGFVGTLDRIDVFELSEKLTYAKGSTLSPSQ